MAWHEKSLVRRIAIGLSAGLISVGAACSKPQGVALPVEGGPPLGHYVCWASGFDDLYSGEFTVGPQGQYTDMLESGGRFVYDAGKKTIVFTTGNFKYWEFIAVYQMASESANGRERLVLKDESAPAPIGKERQGEYQYCYLGEKMPRGQNAEAKR